jgi:predicted acetyltransferase
MWKGIEMTSELVSASINDKSVLGKLLELYLYDFSEFDGADVNEHGLFGYSRLDYYWNEKDRFPYIFMTDQKYSGFALIRSEIVNNDNIFSVAEYFIMKKYRMNGIGKEMFSKIIEKHSGKWNVPVLSCNKSGTIFWKKIINEITKGKYEIISNNDWDGPIYSF